MLTSGQTGDNIRGMTCLRRAGNFLHGPVVHRALGRDAALRRPDGAARRPYHPDMAEIASIAEHISTTERNAAEAEIDAAQMKKLEFFQQQLDQRNPQIFSAAIVDVRNSGLMVELPDALIKIGRAHV